MIANGECTQVEIMRTLKLKNTCILLDRSSDSKTDKICLVFHYTQKSTGREKCGKLIQQFNGFLIDKYYEDKMKISFKCF